MNAQSSSSSATHARPSSHTGHAHTDRPASQTGIRKWIPLIVLSLALLIIILDTTILNVSLRTIIGDLGTTIQKIQWVITAYSLMLAALTVTGGRLGDIFGRKRMFVLGAIIFAIGSFITSISNSVGMMIVGEAIIEGIGAALMTPATSSLLVSNYSGRDRQIAFGIWGGIAAGGAALGPVIGGWLTTFYSWRWAFRINVFVAAILVGASFLLKESQDNQEKPQIDFMGIVLSVVSLFLIVFGFIEASTYGWIHAKATFMIGSLALNFPGNISVVVFSIFLGLIFMYLFVLWERRRERQYKTPLVSLAIFKNSQFTLGATIVAILSLGQAGLSFALPVFYQSVKGVDAFETGLLMLPMSIMLLISSPTSAYLSKFFTPKRIMQTGLILDVLGFITIALGIQTGSSVWALAPGLVLFGIGMGFLFSQASNMTMSAVSVQQSGEASGVNSTLRLLGSTLGSAVLGSILLSTLATNLVSGVQASAVIPEASKPAISQLVDSQTSNIEFGSGVQVSSSQSVSPEVTTAIKSISESATVKASHVTIYTGVFFMLIAFILSFWLPNNKNVETQKSPAAVH